MVLSLENISLPLQDDHLCSKVEFHSPKEWLLVLREMWPVPENLFLESKVTLKFRTMMYLLCAFSLEGR